ncbi:PPC domain-containing DNA-binding protein [Ferrimonas senticii]|uniref:PPC domain-containing DNA-binding protein n=1 Tax=Ferrimonas senticii TaxID=394566 RepID=UPI0004228B62|nr:PPC domain-containing DNA-binding protein [Ferrimonas senticii]
MNQPISAPLASAVSAAEFHVLRLLPGQELLSALQQWLEQQPFDAAFIASAVGSLSVASLRFAAQEHPCVIDKPFEVHALSGTLDRTCPHLHISLSDGQGQMIGGHLMPGCIVRTTLELVIGVLPSLHFGRAPCPHSGYDELTVTYKED